AQTPAGRAFQLSDWYRVTQLSTPTLSPDGMQVAFTVTTVREAENKRHQEVWIQAVTGGPARRVTSPGFESSAPRWSDDGKLLNFTSNRPGGGRGNGWAVRMDEGGEAFQPEPVRTPAAAGGVQPADKSFTITSGDNGAGAGRGGARGGGAFPGGRGGASGADSTTAVATGPFAKMPPMARPPVNAITKPADPARFDGRHITDEAYKSNDGGFRPSTGRGGRGGAAPGAAGGRGGAGGAPPTPPAQLYIQRTGGERIALTSDGYSHRAPSVSPDGKWIVFSADPRLRTDSVVTRERDSLAKLPPVVGHDPADRNDADLFILPVASCEAHSADCKPRHVEFFGTESDIVWSPDSRQIAFVGRAGRFKSSRLYLLTAEGGKPQDILGSWKYEPGNIEWWGDGKIRMITSTGGNSGLYQIDPATKQVSAILGGRREVTGIQYDKAKSRIVYLATDLTHPNELYTSKIDGTGEQKLTGFNDALNKEVAWSDAERFTYRSVDNLEIEAWLMKPYGYQPGKKYPLVLYIHGGPHSAYGEGWFDEFQNLAAEGFMVLYTNPRGSSGTNGEFTNASRGDWGGKDYLDIMKAVDIAAVRADVDSNRMGVTGGSYGGYMTAWVETKTNRFKAAETDRMISEWTYWWGSSDSQSLTNGEFFGKPWDNQAMYDSLSPIRHVKNVKTPTLLVQSEEDFRTPMGNAELWFMALKQLGVPAEFVRYPRSTLELSRSGEPWLLVDRLGRLRQWFGYWLAEGGPKPATTAAPPGNERR
ncbi:MAG: prolyl oligopeptidase family serine peptidase, partial [Gemmatimonadota bacterium]